MASELKNTAKLVKEILTSNEAARNSDDYLYNLVCLYKLSEFGIKTCDISLEQAMLRRKELNLPAFETVRRTRQKVQQHFPWLSGCADVEAVRTLKEEEFREYAREVVI